MEIKYPKSGKKSVSILETQTLPSVSLLNIYLTAVIIFPEFLPNHIESAKILSIIKIRLNIKHTDLSS